jgi:hypothetical protein
MGVVPIDGIWPLVLGTAIKAARQYAWQRGAGLAPLANRVSACHRPKPASRMRWARLRDEVAPRTVLRAADTAAVSTKIAARDRYPMMPSIHNCSVVDLPSTSATSMTPGGGASRQGGQDAAASPRAGAWYVDVSL